MSIDYYDESYPPSLWTTPPPPALATGATAGTPGVYTPPGSRVPANVTELNTVTATPTTAWAPGQYVTTGSGAHFHWSGTAWVAGDAPVEEGTP